MAALLKICHNCFRISTNLYFLRRISSKISDDDQPIKFSSSKAANWKAKNSLEGVQSDTPKSQGFVIAICLSTFLIYFCVLREENDIDEMLGSQSAWKQVPGLEEGLIKAAIQEHKKLGKDTSELENALKHNK
ncbi:uncharacterized protein LOC111614955 [Centruroides sculpturatus]|uniref:uncharacterized protein LOC111614955 n=1 Tax=Centruroides sculpturatus TaxID=218467 RepID=UPI000C6EAC3C|nr:uncharacterized protein LOC111614955 [Centruroides sculpturatus]